MKELVDAVASVLADPSSTTADVMRLQNEASQLPDWAAHSAHMEFGLRLNAKQR